MKGAYVHCTCGHENRLHAAHDKDDPRGYECQMVGCECRVFKAAEREPSTLTHDERALAKEARAGWAHKMLNGGRAKKKRAKK